MALTRKTEIVPSSHSGSHDIICTLPCIAHTLSVYLALSWRHVVLSLWFRRRRSVFRFHLFLLLFRRPPPYVTRSSVAHASRLSVVWVFASRIVGLFGVVDGLYGHQLLLRLKSRETYVDDAQRDDLSRPRFRLFRPLLSQRRRSSRYFAHPPRFFRIVDAFNVVSALGEAV